MDVDTRVLRYFVAVAEHLSFTRAARSLFVSQPSLSRQIRQLEDRLGTRLFVRTRTEVRLTRTGEILLTAARRQLADWEQITRIVRTTAAAEGHLLRVGFVAEGVGPLGRRARAAFLARHPYVTVEPKRFDRGGEAAALRQGLVDVAFLALPADTTELHTAVVASEPRIVAMPASHRLAARAALTVADLHDEPVLSGVEKETVEEMLDQVVATGALCLGPASMAANHPHPQLTWRPMADLDPVRIAVAWPRTTANPLVSVFVQIVCALAKP
jgi:DNA-binding transcriptional LysR family regulator